MSETITLVVVLEEVGFNFPVCKSVYVITLSHIRRTRSRIRGLPDERPT
jgi:hypothetical protein